MVHLDLTPDTKEDLKQREAVYKKLLAALQAVRETVAA
jgi:hypothetical protein